MRAAHLYGLFSQDREGPLFRAFCYDLEEAKLKARSLADKEGLVYLIFDFHRLVEVDRMVPLKSESPDGS